MTTVDPTVVEGIAMGKDLPPSMLRRLAEWRKSLRLGNPGTIENATKDIKQTFLTNLFFDGARADLTKYLSPTFQVTHAFHSATALQPAGYSFGAAYATETLLIHGTLDNSYQVNARLHSQITPQILSKIHMQLPRGKGQNMAQFELDYQGDDFSISAKMVNPSPTDATGIYLLGYLQSVTPNLALGAELTLQRPQPGLEDSSLAYTARWTSDKRDKIVSVQLQPGAFQASYWQKIEEKVDAGAEIQFAAGPRGRRDAVCNIGAKWEFSSATFRTLLDSRGRIQMLMEERLAPGFGFQLSGELDHLSGKSKVGLALVMET